MRNGNRFGSFAEDDDDGDEASWQDSYSDLMTDLLAIFVILFAFAMMSQAIEIQKTRAANDRVIIASPFESSDLSGPESIMPGNEGIMPDQESVMAEDLNGDNQNAMTEEEEFNNLYEYIKDYINETGLSDQLSVSKQGNKEILLRVAASVFFDSGKADINPKSVPILDKISKILNIYDESIKIIRIEGHTDDHPIKTSQYESNWELSTSRAVNVLKWLLETSGLNPKKFSAVGYSEYYPIADNDKETGRAKNRRVDFFIEAADN